MTQFLILREVQDGAARLIGITTDTTMTPRQIADQWVTTRDEIMDPIRLHFADVGDVKTVQVNPEVVRRATTILIPPEEAFVEPPIVEIPSEPPPA